MSAKWVDLGHVILGELGEWSTPLVIDAYENGTFGIHDAENRWQPYATLPEAQCAVCAVWRQHLQATIAALDELEAAIEGGAS